MNYDFFFAAIYDFRFTVYKADACRRAGHTAANGGREALCGTKPEWLIIMYIDPGTGGMLFTVLFGAISTLIYFFRIVFIKVRFRLSGGKTALSSEKIPLVIFSDNKRYWPVFSPICRELDALGKDVVYYTMSEDDPAFECGYAHVKTEYIGSGNKAFAKMNMLNAVIVLSTTPGLDVYQWKRSKNVDHYVHIPHAANEIVLYRMFGIDYYDSVLLSGEYQRSDLKMLEELRGLPEKETEIVGIPYMDEMAEKLKNSGEAPLHPFTVLLAPSWGKSAIFSVYGDRVIKALLKTDHHIIIRPHPQSFISETEMMEQLMKKYPDSERLEWDRSADNFETLRRSDILISDFSGIVFDFALVCGKPVIYTSPDLDLSVYDAWWLDKPIWTLSALERIGAELNADNIDILDKLIDSCINDPKYAQGREEVRNETWAYRGEGAKRAASYLAEKYKELASPGEDSAQEGMLSGAN